jgi:aspartyl-tRNA(Asn)/glutamyl-tRNA(Gln) amidotransferase subunit C
LKVVAMKIDQTLVKKVADLANLSLNDSEVVHYEKQLGRILGFIEQLSELKDALGSDWRNDTEGESTPERSDEARASLSPEEALAGAPKKIGSAFQAPRIIEEN